MERYEFKDQGEVARIDQLHEVVAMVMRRIEGPRGTGIAMLAKEIAKNVIDHAGGRGFVEIAPDEGHVATIVIRDYGPGFSHGDMLPDGASSKAGNGTNYSQGLLMIEDVATTPDLSVTLAREHLEDGVRYTITLLPKAT